jgi:hypothetical protein
MNCSCPGRGSRPLAVLGGVLVQHRCGIRFIRWPGNLLTWNFDKAPSAHEPRAAETTREKGGPEVILRPSKFLLKRKLEDYCIPLFSEEEGHPYARPLNRDVVL